MLIENLIKAGVEMLNITVGNPYYNPHVNRPYKKGAYIPNESAETGLARFEMIEERIKTHFKELALVASGLSYYRAELIKKMTTGEKNEAL